MFTEANVSVVVPLRLTQDDDALLRLTSMYVRFSLFVLLSSQ